MLPTGVRNQPLMAKGVLDDVQVTQEAAVDGRAAAAEENPGCDRLTAAVAMNSSETVLQSVGLKI